MLKKLLTVIVLALFASSGLRGQAQTRESLRGLTGVFLYVLPVGKDVEAGGLSTEQVKAAAEKSLRKAGITLYSEPRVSDGSANLAIAIDIVKHPQGPFLYSVSVSLVQEVHLARTNSVQPFPAQTWIASAFGLTSPNRTDLILEPAIAKLDEFIKDFKAMNTP